MNEPLAVIHIAGPNAGGVQGCSRCGTILSDYRRAMVALEPGATKAPALPGWTPGKEVLVMEGNPRFLALVESLRADRDTSDEVACG